MARDIFDDFGITFDEPVPAEPQAPTAEYSLQREPDIFDDFDISFEGEPAPSAPSAAPVPAPIREKDIFDDFDISFGDEPQITRAEDDLFSMQTIEAGARGVIGAAADLATVTPSTLVEAIGTELRDRNLPEIAGDFVKFAMFWVPLLRHIAGKKVEELASFVTNVEPGEDPNAIQKKFGEVLAEWGKTSREYWQDKTKNIKPDAWWANKSVFDNPEVLQSPTWWAYNVGNLGTNLLATIIPGMAAKRAYTMSRFAGRLSPKTMNRFAKLGDKVLREVREEAIKRGGRIAGMLAGGTAGGTLEATGTYNSVIEAGGSHKEARDAAQLMFLYSAGLNAVSLGKWLDEPAQKLLARLGQRLGRGTLEAVTEGLEEPAEAVAMIQSKIENGEIPEDSLNLILDAMKDSLDVAGPSLLLGLLAPLGGKSQAKASLARARRIFGQKERMNTAAGKAIAEQDLDADQLSDMRNEIEETNPDSEILSDLDTLIQDKVKDIQVREAFREIARRRAEEPVEEAEVELPPERAEAARQAVAEGKFVSRETGEVIDVPEGQGGEMETAQAHIRERYGIRPEQIGENKVLTRDQRDVMQLAEAIGSKVTFYNAQRGTAVDNVNGFYLPDNNHIYINTNNESPTISILGHESFHQLRRDDAPAFNSLMDIIEETAENLGAYSIRLNQNREAMGETPMAQRDILEEFSADVVGNQFAQTEFWKRIQQQDAPLGEKLAKKTLAMIDKVKKLFAPDDVRVREAERVEKAIAEVYGDLIKRREAARARRRAAAAEEAPEEQRLAAQVKKALDVKKATGEGGVIRLSYFDGGKEVGTARLLGTTIGDVEVSEAFRRQGYGRAILADLYKRGGRTAFVGSEAGAKLMKSAGMVEIEDGRFVFPEDEIKFRIKDAEEAILEKRPTEREIVTRSLEFFWDMYDAGEITRERLLEVLEKAPVVKLSVKSTQTVFNVTQLTETINIKDLFITETLTREKIDAAKVNILQAITGRRPKRKPITVYRRETDGRLAIIDGNSTTAALKELGGITVFAEVFNNAVQANVNSLNDSYILATEVREEMIDVVNKLGRQLKQFDAKALHRPDLKDRKRAREKEQAYGHARFVKDIVGSTLTFRDADAVRSAAKMIEKQVDVIEIEDRMAESKDGYNDMVALVRLSNGYMGELLLIEEVVQAVKGVDKTAPGHRLFDVTRALREHAKNTENPEFLPVVDQLDANSKRLYDHFRAFGIPAAKPLAFPAEISRDLLTILEDPGTLDMSTSLSPSNRNIFADFVSYLKGTPSLTKKRFAITIAPPFKINLVQDPVAVKQKIMLSIKKQRMADMAAWKSKLNALGPDVYSVYEAGLAHMVEQVKARKWEVPFEDTQFGKVNNRLARELDVFEQIFGDSPLAQILPAKKAGEPTRSITSYDLLLDMFRVVDNGDLAQVMDRAKSIRDVAIERGVKGAQQLPKEYNGTDAEKKKYANLMKTGKLSREAWSFQDKVYMLRKGKLYREVDEGGADILSNNGKAGMSTDLSLGTCHPTMPCRECYAAGMTRQSIVNKAIRNTLHLLADPKGWGRAVAAEAAHVPKEELSFIRLQGSGDIILKEQVTAYNEIAKFADRPIQIFSRHHDMLRRLKGTAQAPFLKVGSIDIDLFKHYGEKFLRENMTKYGIMNAWLYLDPSEIPSIEKLAAEDKNGNTALALVLAANDKLHTKLPVNIQSISCPCDADERSYHQSCRQCALSYQGCFLMMQQWAVDQKGKLWHLRDPKIPKKNYPILQFLQNVNVPDGWTAEAFVYSKIVQRLIDKSIHLAKNTYLPQLIKGEKKSIPLKDVRWPKDIIRLSDPKRLQAWINNMELIKGAAALGTFYLPGGPIQPPIAFKNGVKLADATVISDEDAKTLAFATSPVLLSVKKYPVGKYIGGAIYVHRSAEHHLPDVETAKESLPEDFVYDVVKYNEKTGGYTFTQSKDFHTADEPTVGDSILVRKDGTTKKMPQAKDPWIYHHKWMFVDSRYTGFDRNASMRRTEFWTGLENVDKSRIGKRSYWDEKVVPRIPNDENLEEFKRTYKNDEIAIANATARAAGAIGAKAKVPRVVQEIADKKWKILDFGAGPTAAHMINLQKAGFKNTTSYEFGDNADPMVHDLKALKRKHDLVYASNVMNVQNSAEMFAITMRDIVNATKANGTVVINMPADPRKGFLGAMKPAEARKYLRRALENEFEQVTTAMLDGKSQNDIFVAKKKRKISLKVKSAALIFRGEGIGGRAAEAVTNLLKLTRAGYVYRGMTQTEYKNTIGKGKGAISTKEFSFAREGTSFSEHLADAESYVNYGRDDPRTTGKPNYIIEVKKDENLVKNRQGYFEAAKEIPRSQITNVWEMRGNEDNEIIATKITGKIKLKVKIASQFQSNMPTFQRWFGKSIAKDPDGQPMVLFHGARSTFNEFDIRGMQNVPLTTFGSRMQAAFFTEDPGYASTFARYRNRVGVQPQVYPVFLKLENPVKVGDVGDEVGLDTLAKRLGIKLSDFHKDFVDENTGRRKTIWMWYSQHPEVFDAVKKKYDGLDAIEAGHRMLAVFKKSQIKSIFNRGQFDVKADDISLSIKKGVWYSQMEKLFEQKLPGKGTGKSYLQTIEAWAKKGMIKAEEWEWSGLKDILEETPQTKYDKAMIMELLAENNIRVEEIVLGEIKDVKSFREDVAEWFEERAHDELYNRFGNTFRYRQATDKIGDIVIDYVEYGEDSAIREAADELDIDLESIQEQVAEERATQGEGARHIDYTMEGGENYRELLITMPSMWEDRYLSFKKRLVEKHGFLSRDLMTEDELVLHEHLNKMALYEREFVGPDAHFGDTPNILVSVRFNERQDSEGRKVLFIEEIQSDWHQEGFKQGYETAAEKAEAERRLQRLIKAQRNMWIDQTINETISETFIEEQGRWPTEREREIITRTATLAAKDKPAINIAEELDQREQYISALNASRVEMGAPDGPFKKSWPMLGMKRMVRWAAENGFDAVGWTPGEVQIERYNLQKHLSEIRYRQNRNDGRWKIRLYDLEGNRITRLNTSLNIDSLATSELNSLMGKGLADRLRAGEGKPLEDDYLSLTGEDLVVGGAAMNSFYDQQLVNETNKIFNKAAWGKSRVGVISIPDVVSEPKRYEGPSFAADHEAYKRWLKANLNLSVTGKELIVMQNPTLLERATNVYLDMIRLGKTFGEAMVHYGDAKLAEKLGGEMFGGELAQQQVWALPITTEIKEKALQEGMPKFSVKDLALDKHSVLRRQQLEKVATGEALEAIVLNEYGIPYWSDFMARRSGSPVKLVRREYEELYGPLRKVKVGDQTEMIGDGKPLAAILSPLQWHNNGYVYDQEVFQQITATEPFDGSEAQISFSAKKGQDQIAHDYIAMLESSLPTPGVTGPEKTVNPLEFASEDVRIGIERSKGVKKPPFMERAKARIVETWQAFRRHRPYLDPKSQGDVLNILRIHQEVPENARRRAMDVLSNIIGEMDPNQYSTFTLAIIMDDMMKDLESGLLSDVEGLPFGFKTRKEAETFRDKVYEIVANDAMIRSALDRRRNVNNKLRQILVKYGLLDESVLEDDRYFHHQVMVYREVNSLGEQFGLATGTAQKRIQQRKMGWQKARKGSILDYNTEYAQSEFEVLAQAFVQLETMETLNRLKAAADRTAEVKEVAKARGLKNWEDAIPPGFTQWSPAPGSAWFKANSIPDRIMHQVLDQQLALTDENIQEVIRSTWARGRDPRWVISEGLAKTLNEFGAVGEDHVLGRASRFMMGAWKKWILINPFRVLKYNINNLSGDFDIAFAYDVRITGKIYGAARDLLKDWRRQELPTSLRKELELARRLGVIGSGWSVQEISEVAKELSFENFKAMMDGTKPELIERLMRSPKTTWKFLKDFTAWRENWIRLGAFRFFREQIAAGEQNLYGASNRNEVDAIKNDNERAAKLARDLIGDYGNISHAGQWIRAHMIPFYAWLEVNAPRYVRLMRNLKHEGKDTKFLSAVMAKKAVFLTLKASMLMVLVQLWNRFAFPDEEDELTEAQRRQQHIILGRRADGSVRTLRFQGALSDALAWFGLENPWHDIEQIVKGKVTAKEQLVEMGKAPFIKVIAGFRPDVKVAGEALVGYSLYPDPFSPRPIRDRIMHIARMFSMDKLYAFATGKPRRGDTPMQRLWHDISSLMIYGSDPGEGAYYQTKAWMYTFLDRIDVERSSARPTSRANAMYYYRQALKFGDLPAAERYLRKYYQLGGTYDGLQQSIKRAHPLAGMRADHRRTFLASLNPRQREVIDMAIAWYIRTYIQGQRRVPIGKITREVRQQQAKTLRTMRGQ